MLHNEEIRGKWVFVFLKGRIKLLLRRLPIETIKVSVDDSYVLLRREQVDDQGGYRRSSREYKRTELPESIGDYRESYSKSEYLQRDDNFKHGKKLKK